MAVWALSSLVRQYEDHFYLIHFCGNIPLNLDTLLCFISTVNFNFGTSYILVSYCSNNAL